jgi:hypothetical protein
MAVQVLVLVRVTVLLTVLKALFITGKPIKRRHCRGWQCCQVSISPTFYEQLLCQNPFAKKLPTQMVSTLKVCKELWYEKAACKILVKLTVIPKFFAQLLSAFNLAL